jgi:hypothetical protein
VTAQVQYDQSAAALRSAMTEVKGELTARQAEVAEQVKQDETAFAALAKQLSESKVDEPPPAPARRPEDDDLSASAAAYQEEPDEEPAPLTPPPVTRTDPDEEEVPSFQWDEDQPAAPTPPPHPPAQPKRARPARAAEEDEDLSDHDWLE